MNKQTFAGIFFRIYDRKLGLGEITFRETKLSKDDFTSLCTDADFVPPNDVIEMLCDTMKLSDEEAALLRSFGKNKEDS